MTSIQIANQLIMSQFNSKENFNRLKDNMLFAKDRLEITNCKDAYSFVSQSTMSLIESANNITISKKTFHKVINMVWAQLEKQNHSITKLF